LHWHDVLTLTPEAADTVPVRLHITFSENSS
jgi:hypothetical protein